MSEESERLKAACADAEQRYVGALRAPGFSALATLLMLLDCAERARAAWMGHRKDCTECREERAAG